ncbi:hypothetical protein ABIB25_001955 [Nakamurella sp. UYEF19]|uniref:hypothetical protein n=1 Tax=Nakamurella sp. UYEF19 TaxID=1756392 RepID=UPI003394AD0D
MLKPGGELVYTFLFTGEGERPQLAIFDPEMEASRPRILVLPQDAETSEHGQGPPVWEDHDHLLFSCSGLNSRMTGPDMVRLDVRTGDLEQVGSTSARPGPALFVEPLLG